MNSNAPGGEAPTTPYVVQDMDHLGLMAGMVDELGLVERIDGLIPQDFEQRNLSIGLVVKAMILNGLGFIQRALPDPLVLPEQATGTPVGAGDSAGTPEIRLLRISQTQQVVLSVNEQHRAELALLGNRYVDLYTNSA